MRWRHALVLFGLWSCADTPALPTDPAVDETLQAFDDLPPLRRLTTWEVENILAETLRLESVQPGFSGLPFEASAPFDNDVATQAPQLVFVEAVEAMATRLTEELLDDPTRFDEVVRCRDDGCLPQVVSQLGEQLWRNPLTPAEVDLLVDAAAALEAPTTFEQRVAFVLSAMMQDPAFLYVVELGTPDVAPSGRRWLSQDEIETRMALLLLGSSPVGGAFPPDGAADLRDPAARIALAGTLLQDRRARTVINRFHSQWMGYVGSLPWDAAQGMRLQADAMVEHVVFDEPQPWTELFRISETWLDPRLHELYDLPGEPLGPGWQDPALPERRGLLSWGAFLSAGGRSGETSPTLRGKLVADRLSCSPVPPPPPDVPADAPPVGEVGSCKADRYAVHNSDPACAGCHDRLDGVGMGLEGFDPYARTRVFEQDEFDQDRTECPVPTEGALPNLGSFSGPVELADLLLDEGVLQRCMVQHFLQWADRRGPLDSDPAEAQQRTDAWLAAGGEFQQLLLDHVAADSFAQVGDP